MGTAEELGMTAEEFAECLKTMDELDEFPFGYQRRLYVLKEREEGRQERIHPINLRKYLPLDEIRWGQSKSLTKESHYVDVEGSYYPDYLEENGACFATTKLFWYLKQKLELGEIEFNHVGFMSEERRRVEEYCLLVPPVVDCIKKETACYDKTGRLTYFEIDEDKVGELEVFRIKGFPHIIVVDKLNRLDFAGYECCRLENSLDYEGERDRRYQECLNGGELQKAVAEYERRAQEPEHVNCLYGMRRVLSDKEQIRREIRDGLARVLNSYNQEEFSAERLSERYYMLNWSWKNCQIVLTETQKPCFNIHEFSVASMRPVLEFINNLPEELEAHAKKLVFGVVLEATADALRIFETYNNIHGNELFRWYLQQQGEQAVNPPLVYDYKSSLQREVESTKSLVKYDFTGLDLREFDFSGKDLTGLKLKECNLRRAKFNGCVLNQAEFTGCNLTGAEFTKAQLKEAVFTNNELDRANFDYAEMRGVNITGSDLLHASFIKSDLTDGRIANDTMTKAYFYRARLMRAVFELENEALNCVFRLCDLRNAQFAGNPENELNALRFCDFHHANLSESKMEMLRVTDTVFIKAKLNGADFSKCETLQKCNCRWSVWHGVKMGSRLQAIENDFSFVDLSRISEKSGALFSGNDFSYANLSGYDFSVGGYVLPNELIYTNMSGCNLEYAELAASKIIYPQLKEANLSAAVLKPEQLRFMELSDKQRREIELEEEVF